MEEHIRKALLSAVTDKTVLIEEIHLFHHWIVIKAGRYEMSTRFAAVPGLIEDPSDTWLGELIGKKAYEIAEQYLSSVNVLHIAVGMACLKCVIPEVKDFFESSAMDHFSEETKFIPSCFIGHFHDAARWRSEGRPVSIIELKPREFDIHWDDSFDVLKKAELVFMTGLTLVNRTFSEVVRRTPNAVHRIIMGPTVPLTPVLFQAGLHWLGTTSIADVDKTLHYFGMGGGSVMYAPEGALKKLNIGLKDGNKKGVNITP